VWTDDVVRQKLPRLVDDCNLAPGSKTGVNAQNRNRARGSGEQKIGKIIAEDLDGVDI